MPPPAAIDGGSTNGRGAAWCGARSSWSCGSPSPGRGLRGRLSAGSSSLSLRPLLGLPLWRLLLLLLVLSHTTGAGAATRLPPPPPPPSPTVVPIILLVLRLLLLIPFSSVKKGTTKLPEVEGRRANAGGCSGERHRDGAWGWAWASGSGAFVADAVGTTAISSPSISPIRLVVERVGPTTAGWSGGGGGRWSGACESRRRSWSPLSGADAVESALPVVRGSPTAAGEEDAAVRSPLPSLSPSRPGDEAQGGGTRPSFWRWRVVDASSSSSSSSSTFLGKRMGEVGDGNTGCGW